MPEYEVTEQQTLALLLHLSRGMGSGHTAVHRGGWGVQELIPLYRCGEDAELVSFGKITWDVAVAMMRSRNS